VWISAREMGLVRRERQGGDRGGGSRYHFADDVTLSRNLSRKNAKP